MTARLRVVHPEPARPHLALVDNMSGVSIVAQAKKQQATFLEPVAEPVERPVNRARKRTVKPKAPKNGPVIVTQHPLEKVHPLARARALDLAGGNRLRCQVQLVGNDYQVLVVNNPPGTK